jgi:hypothetical protein
MSMSPESNLIVKYLKASGSSTLDELHAQLPQEARPKFLKRISNLKAMGWLLIETDSDGQRHYRLAPSAVRKAVLLEKAKRLEAVATTVEPLPIVPPRRLDVMRSGLWRPDPAPVMRSGADDHRRHHSLGLRC